jgi:DNA-directed RNA polymerase subunit L
MNKVKSIQISKIEQEKKLGFSILKLNMKGDNINHVVVNSIKRIIQTDIPIYAFNNFDITENSSVFNNNYIKGHLQNIPVWGIDNKIDEYIKKEENDDEEFSETTGLVNDDIDLDVEKDVDTSALNKLTMYIDSKNDTNDILTVTTNDAKFYYKEGLIDSPYYNPIQLVKLQPKDVIKFSAKAELGTEEISGIYSATSICFFKENSENDYEFILESRGQITEKRILKIALKLLNKKLHKFNKNLPKNKGMEGTIVTENEDHTLGNIISYGMQIHPAVQFCGYNTPHPLKREIHFHYKLLSGNINNIIKEVVSYYENIFDNISEKLDKL